MITKSKIGWRWGKVERLKISNIEVEKRLAIEVNEHLTITVRPHIKVYLSLNGQELTYSRVGCGNNIYYYTKDEEKKDNLERVKEKIKEFWSEEIEYVTEQLTLLKKFVEELDEDIEVFVRVDDC